MTNPSDMQQQQQQQEQQPSPQRKPPPRRRSLLGLLRPQRTDSIQQDEPVKSRSLQRRRSIAVTTSLYRGGGGGGKAGFSEDEELSVTTAATCTSNLTSNTANTTTKTTKKSVRFASKDKNVYHNNEQLCLEECQELWISRDEYQKLQASLQFLSAGLERAEKFAADNPSSYTNVLLYVYALCSDQTRACNSSGSSARTGSGNSNHGTTAIILKEDEMQELTQRLRLSSNRLGLERRIIPQFRKERFTLRRQMLQQIQQIQSSSSHHKKGHNAVVATHIRQVCESISRPSRLFSLHMAHALAATV